MAVVGYDLERLTPAGAVTEHLDAGEGVFETDGPWLFIRRADGVALRLLPAHAVVDVRACEGGPSCGATTTV